MLLLRAVLYPILSWMKTSKKRIRLIRCSKTLKLDFFSTNHACRKFRMCASCVQHARCSCKSESQKGDQSHIKIQCEFHFMLHFHSYIMFLKMHTLCMLCIVLPLLKATQTGRLGEIKLIL